MTKTTVYVPAGIVGGLPGHMDHVPLGETKRANFAITASALRPNIPGVNLVQVHDVNGIAVDGAGLGGRVDMNPRTYVLKK